MQTTDLKIASALMTCGFTLESVEKVSERQAEFHFAWHEDMDATIMDFINGNLQVDASQLLNNYDSLKSRATAVTRM